MAKKPKKIVLNDDANNFTGSNASEKIFGNGGDDNISGGRGNDKIYGGDGNDSLKGGRGNDRLDGGAGDDNMLGGDGDDLIIAGVGTDTVDGGAGDDTLKINVNYADATVTKDGDGFEITTATGTISVKNVELFQFADKTLTADNVVPPPDGIFLTEQADTVTGDKIFAPRGFTPGGTDQVNTLNDDDVINGTGDDATLTVDFVNDADTGDNNIQATIKNVANIITNVRTDGDATIDLQDSSGATTGYKNLEVRGVDDFATFTYDNIQNDVAQLTVRDSSADNGFINFLFDEDAVSDAADSTKLVLENASVAELSIDPESGAAGVGIEKVAVEVTDDNVIGVLSIEDVEEITVTGAGDLEIGSEDDFTFNNRVEATIYTAGLANVAGSLTKIDATGLTGDLVLNLGDEVTGVKDDTSGTKLDITVIGGDGNDTFRLLSGFDSAGDSIDGGKGDNTLVVFSSVADGKITNVPHLEVRNQVDTTGGGAVNAITVDASLFTGLTDILVRNEGFFTGPAQALDSTVTLNKLTAAQAAAITVLHSTTGSNDVDDNTIVANLAADTAADTVALTIKDGVNSDPRFNLELTADSGLLATNLVESITLDDQDTESNTVDVTNAAEHTGTITLKGGKAGDFLNLDVNVFGGGGEGIYGLDTDGGTDDDGSTGTVKDATTGSAANALDVFGGAANRFGASTIDASTYTGDVVIRVSDQSTAAGVFTALGGQKITMGAGNDTVIFDQISAAGNETTAGLTISDVVDGGAGNDTLALDGNGFLINISASEWTNVSNFENIRLIGNGLGGTNDVYGNNSYNLTLTNDLVSKNGVAVTGGRVINIINDNDLTDGLNNSGTGLGFANQGVTIDARTLDSKSSFSYNGAEGPTMTADRFIMSDANINGLAIIDGGAAFLAGYAASAAANDDVLEIRNAAVATLGDLANLKNIGTLEFTNDTAATQSSNIQLSTAVIDALVNSEHTASTTEVETLTVRAVGNSLVPGANTVVTIDGSGIDFTKVGLTLETDAGGFFVLSSVAGPVTFNGGDGDDNFTGTAQDDTINGGLGDDTLNGGAGDDTINAGVGADRVDGGAGDDTIDFGADADVDTLVFSSSTDGFDTVTNFFAANDVIDIGGLINDVGAAGINGVEAANGDATALAANIDALEFIIVDNFEGGEITSFNFDNLIAVAAEIEEEFNLTNDTFVGEDMFIAVETSDTGDTALYYFHNLDSDNTFDANELTLLGIVDQEVTTTNFTL